jgi:hypothetical protein
MPSCDYCGSMILLGGVRDGASRFCNAQCHQKGSVLTAASQVPADVVAQQVQMIHQGQCPRCQGPGPVDVHTSHTVWSALVMTSWSSKPHICCRSCGTKSKLGGAVSSLVFGWWGFPWGLVFTPVQVCRNVVGILSPPDPETPSPQLVKLVRIGLAQARPQGSVGRAP